MTSEQRFEAKVMSAINPIKRLVRKCLVCNIHFIVTKQHQVQCVACENHEYGDAS